jgi:nicotinate-nucleotide adenylyltransferase
VSRIGIFGGTFDPVHHGHLMMAQEAVARLKLDRMLFVAANRPSHKRAPDLADVEHRIAMLRLAVKGNRSFEVSRLEADLGGYSYTVNTLEALRRTTKGDLFFLMGQDSLEEFGRWVKPDRILELARLIVVPRGDGDMPSLPQSLRRRVVYVKPPRIGICSSEVRRRLKRGLPVRYWIPDLVLSYLIRHGLYGTGSRRR